jgi:hypothetical protein
MKSLAHFFENHAEKIKSTKMVLLVLQHLEIAPQI